MFVCVFVCVCVCVHAVESVVRVRGAKKNKGEKQEKRSTGKYLYHAMPSGAVPVPKDPITKKRVVGGYEFFYQGWKHPSLTRFNCRLGSDMNTVFPEGREVQLDAVYLKKMGLTKKRMDECDALFFYPSFFPVKRKR